MYQNPWTSDSSSTHPGLGLCAAPPLPPIGQLPSAPQGDPGRIPSGPPNKLFPTSAPPPPPRPSQFAQQPVGQNYPYQGFGGYRNYPRYGAGGYPGNPGFSDFSQNFSLNPQNPPNYSAIPPNRFVELAEASSLPAFQTIQSVVQTFGSVSMMLESTFHAVHSSFQAVLTVVDQFSKMKLCLSQIFSAFAALRVLKYLYKKLLFLSGIIKISPGFAETVWQESSISQTRLTERGLKAPIKWPLAVYLGLVCAAPYLVWKFITSVTNIDKKALEDDGDWQKQIGEHFVAKAIYDFSSDRQEELSFNKGSSLVLAPQHLQPRVRGWLLASDGLLSGLVPANYINILGKSQGSQGSQGKEGTKHKPDVVSSAAGLAEEFKSQV